MGMEVIERANIQTKLSKEVRCTSVEAQHFSPNEERLEENAFPYNLVVPKLQPISVVVHCFLNYDEPTMKNKCF